MVDLLTILHEGVEIFHLYEGLPNCIFNTDKNILVVEVKHFVTLKFIMLSF